MLYLRILCLLMLALFFVLAVKAFPGNKLKTLYKEGMTCMKAGRLEDARLCFHQVIQQDSSYTAAYLQLGHIYNTLHNTRAAKEQFREVLQREPTNCDALSAITNLYFEQRDYEDALYAAAEANRQGIEKMYRIMGLCYYHLKEYDNAITSLLAARKEEPSNNSILLQLGQVYAQDNNYHKAIYYYQQYLQKHDGIPENWYALGTFYFNTKDFTNAVKSFEQSGIKGHPMDTSYYLNLGTAYLQTKEIAKGINNLQSCLALSPENTKAIQSIAHTYYTAGNYSESITYWNKLLLLQPENAFATFMLGKSHIGNGNTAKGEELCDKALEASNK